MNKNLTQIKAEAEGLIADLGDEAIKELRFIVDNPEYEHRIPPIREFITSPYYLGRDDVWESIICDLENFYKSGKTEAVLCRGIGAGKSYESSIIACYEIMRVLALKNPQEYFGLGEGSEIDFINVSTKEPQARRVVFGEIKNKIDNSFWFQKYYPPNPYVKSELRFPKNVRVVPGGSLETFPLGMNVFSAIMDEAAFYTVTERKDYAEEMYNAINRRIRSRGNENFRNYGKLVIISSPRYVNDYIERKLREADPNNRIYKDRKALWEMKPPESYSGEKFKYKSLMIPIEHKEDFEKNPEKAERDLMAMPSKSLEPYIKLYDKIKNAISERENPVIGSEDIDPDFWCKSISNYVIHVDLALSKDSCGFAMGHWEDGKVIIDLLLRLTAKPGSEIQFSEVRERIYELSRRKFQIGKVSYDGWQSVDSRQILQRKGYSTSLLSVDRTIEPYDQLKSFLYQGLIEFPYADYEDLEGRQPRTPVEYLIRELEELELIKGKKVDHPPKGSKDISDAVAGVCYWFGREAVAVESSAPKSTPGTMGKETKSVPKETSGSMSKSYGGGLPLTTKRH